MQTPALVTLAKTGPATVLASGNLQYTLTLTNTGTVATGTSLVVKDLLPTGVVYVSATASTNVTSVACTGSGQLKTCTLTLTAALSSIGTASAVFTIETTAPSTAGAITNYASANSDGTSTPPGDPAATCPTSPTTTVCANEVTTVYGSPTGNSLVVEKTVYQGRNSGSGCPGVKELVIVDATHTPKDITWCFAVTNTGNNYLANPVFNDAGLNISAGVNQSAVKLRSGDLPLAPGASATWYVEESRTESLLNTVTVTMTPSSSGGVPIGQPAVSATSSGKTTFAYVYDPPFGIKTGQLNGVNVIRWTMVWINDNAVMATGVVVTDPIPLGMTYGGNLVCTPQGSTVVTSCAFEAPSGSYPRGRVIVVSDMGPDLGATSPANANHALRIAFDASIDNPTIAQSFQNQGTATWQPPSGPPMTGVTTAPGGSSGDPTTVPFVPGVAVAIPTLSEWALILLCGLLGMFAMLRLRRQRL